MSEKAKQIKKLIASLRDRYFFEHFIETLSDKDKKTYSIVALDKRLFPEDYPLQEGSASRIRCFYRYRKGTKITNNEIRQRLYEALPKSQSWHEHILWEILQTPELSLPQTYKLMKRLDKKTLNKAFSKDKITGELSRRQPRNIQHLDSVVVQGDLDGLAYLILVLRESELLERTYAYIAAKWAIWDIFNILVVFEPAFLKISYKLYNHLEKNFIFKNNPIPWPIPQAIFHPISIEEIPNCNYIFAEKHRICREILLQCEDLWLIDPAKKEAARLLLIIYIEGIFLPDLHNALQNAIRHDAESELIQKIFTRFRKKGHAIRRIQI